MLVHKTFKYRIYPSGSQKELLAKHFGCTRFVWNYFLALRRDSYLNNKQSLTYYNNAKTLTELKKDPDYIWLSEVSAQALQASLKDLDTAYGRFFRKKSSFPSFKSRYEKNSFRCPQNTKIKDTGLLAVNKFREGISIKMHRKLVGKILFCTISKTRTNKYFASITVETQNRNLLNNGKDVGIDLGIKDLAITSDGEKFVNIRTTKAFAKKLKYEQAQLAKKQKGSNSRKWAKLKVAKVHEKIKSIRLDHTHKITHKLISENKTVVAEDLNVSGMLKNHCLAKAIQDCSWSELVRQLEYKALWSGRSFVKVGRWFPSSKTCHVCNYIKQDLMLADRTWTCPGCGTELDRDINAAKNILKQGLKILSGCGTQSDIKQKRGEASGS